MPSVDCGPDTISFISKSLDSYRMFRHRKSIWMWTREFSRGEIYVSRMVQILRAVFLCLSITSVRSLSTKDDVGIRHGFWSLKMERSSPYDLSGSGLQHPEYM